MPNDYDADALAQASMALVASPTDRPALTSPQAGLKALAVGRLALFSKSGYHYAGRPVRVG